MNANNENPKVGRLFQELSAKMMGKHFGISFEIDEAILIGEPAKAHKFDCVSSDKKYVAECKCYTWTETGNIPSAKMGFVNEAVFYMSYLPADTTKMIIMKKATHEKRSETLAEYYCRINKHLLKGINVFEIDMENESISVVKG